MKKLFTLIVSTAIAVTVQSQTLYVPNGTSGIGLSTNSNVGIGTTSAPNAKLEVNGNIQLSSATIPMSLMSEVGGTTPLLEMSVNLKEGNRNETYMGAAFRIDTRSTMPLFQWMHRNPGTTWEFEKTVMTLTKDGNLNVYGTQTPSFKIFSASNGSLEMGVASVSGNLASFSQPGDAVIKKAGGTNNIILYLNNNNNSISSVKFGGQNGEIFGIYSNSKAILNGNLLIGKNTQTDPTNKIDVNGKIRADEIIVNTEGADFVFENNYQLRSLSEVEKFIKANKHLPDISCAVQMQTKGVGISELQTKLLMKIEELTLYTIEQDKKLRAQEIKNALLEQKMQEQDVKYMQLLKMVEELKK